MFDTKSQPFAHGANTFGQASSAFFNAVLGVHQKFGSEVLSAASRIAATAYTAKIADEVVESAIREHEGLVGLAFEATRAQFKAAGDLARSQYAGLVQAKTVPCSMLQSAQVCKAVTAAELLATKAVDKLESARKKVVDPMGFPAPKRAKAA